MVSARTTRSILGPRANRISPNRIKAKTGMRTASAFLFCVCALGLGCGEDPTSPPPDPFKGIAQLLTAPARERVLELGGARDPLGVTMAAYHRIAVGNKDSGSIRGLALFFLDYEVDAMTQKALVMGFKPPDCDGGWQLAWSTAGYVWADLSEPPRPEEGRALVDEWFQTGDANIVAAVTDADAWEAVFGVPPPFNYAPDVPAP